MKFKIKSIYMDKIEKKLASLQRKAAKYNGAIKFRVIEELTEENTNPNTKLTYKVNYTVIEVGGIIKNDGWQFVATVEHLPNGNIIRKAIDVDVPDKYKTTPPLCEHCGTNRQRKDTYLVQNLSTKEYKQVGKSCLAEYTHGLDASWVAAYYEFVSECERSDEIYGVGYVGSNDAFCQYDTTTVLAVAFAMVDKYGYVRSGEQDSTKSRVFDYLHGVGQRRKYADIDVNAFDETAKKAIDWLAEAKATNDYMHSLKVLCECDVCERRNYGYIASIPTAYGRYIDYETKRKQAIAKNKAEHANSDYIGDIKERVTIKVQSFRCIALWETDFGIMRLYEFVDADSNVFVWKTSKVINGLGRKWSVDTITGTIKAHKEFRGVKQTELTRCKVVGTDIEVW